MLTISPVMAMPIKLIYNLQISLKQKAGLVCVFSLCFVMIIFAIIRAKQILVEEYFVNLVLLEIWSTLASSICEYPHFTHHCYLAPPSNYIGIPTANYFIVSSCDSRLPPCIQVSHRQQYCHKTQQSRVFQRSEQVQCQQQQSTSQNKHPT